MAAKQDKMLEILKTLRPPDAPSKGGARRAGGPIVDPGVDAAVPPDAGTPASPQPSPSPSAQASPGAEPWRVAPAPAASATKASGRIQLRLEEVGIFFLAAVVLVVLAFLMGWYGRGIAGGTAKTDERSVGPVEIPEKSIVPMDEPAARDLGDKSEKVVPTSSARPYIFSILAARFPPGGEAEAEDHCRLLEERGYSPAWIRPTTEGVELCVGRFEIPTDALALEWLPRLRRLHGAYSNSQLVKVPRE